MRSRDLAAVTIFAALYAAGSFIPGFPIIGLAGSSIEPVRAIEIVYGLLLGPIYGPAAAFLGSVIGNTINGGGSNLFFTPLAAISTFSAACLGRRRVWRIPGWALSAATMIVLIVTWYSTDVGQGAPLYPSLHLLGLAVILVFRGRIADLIHSKDAKKITLGVVLTAFPSTLVGHLLGDLIFIALLHPLPALFMGTLPIAVMERTFLTLLATVVGTPLLILVRRSFPNFERT
ncbi:MAG: hypothetical protein ABSA11_08850 [Candidatus Bathyarchaeia archaeon]|jgi:hypothetical protein